MNAVRWSAAVAIVTLSAVACDNASRAVAPPTTASQSGPAVQGHDAASWAHGGDRIKVRILDQCDPTTFNVAVGPGDCVRDPRIPFHTVSFQDFVGQLQVHHAVLGWYNNPGNLEANPGDVIEAVDRGGEPHTFTRVAKYGGGVVPILNTLAGTPIPAPECAALAPNSSEFLSPGDTDHEAVPGRPGRYHYQCCIHPWMKTDVVVEAGDERHHTPDADDPH